MEKRNIKILYVDDEETWRVVFQRNLNGVFDVITAKNAEEGWQLLKRHSNEIGVIISDQRMPGRPGIELLKQARAYYPKIVRIITTGFSDSTIAIHATNQGAVYHYISKPWNADEIVTVVKRAIDFYMLRSERDSLLERKLSTIQRKTLESKLQGLLVLAVSNGSSIYRSMSGLKAYLKSIRSDPGKITNVKSVFNQSKSELGGLLINLNLVKRLNDSFGEFSDASLKDHAEVRNLLLSVRDEFSQVIYSVRNSQIVTSEEKSRTEMFLSEFFLRLVRCWIGEDLNEKLLEISESDTSEENGEGKRFGVKICKYSDPSPLNGDDEDALFNGINLDEEKELAWLLFLFAVYHCGGTVRPLYLSNQRLAFEIGEFETGVEDDLDSDAVIAELIRKFEAWNYIQFDLETDDD